MSKKEPERLWPFLAVVFLFSYALQALIWLQGGIETAAFGRLAPVVMFVPGITALILVSGKKHGWRSIHWGFGNPWYLVYAAVLPAVMAISLVMVLSHLGWAESPHIISTTDGVNVVRGSFVLGRGDQTIAFFVANLFASALVLGVLNGLVTVGEEVGWRGYLQPRLISRFHFAAAIALLGLIWAHWHTPIILMGYNYPETPLLGALVLWPVTCVCWSFVAAWLTINSGSIWPAVIFHGSSNALLGGLVDGMDPQRPRLASDFLAIAVWAVVAALAYSLTKLPDAALAEASPDPSLQRTPPG